MKLIIPIIFIWAGFILSISFFESWVKFRAAGVTMPVALSIGKLIFTILNRIEWVFVLLLGGFFYFFKIQEPELLVYLLVMIVVILLVQTFWLLPVLNARAVSQINGKEVAASKLHMWFVVLEFFKLLFLLLSGTRFLQTLN